MERCQLDRGQNRAAEYKCALENIITFTIVMSCFMKKGFLHSACSERIQMVLNKIQTHQVVLILWINSSAPSVYLLFCLYSHLGWEANVGDVGNWGSWKTYKTDSIGLNLIEWEKMKHSGYPKHLQSQRWL